MARTHQMLPDGVVLPLDNLLAPLQRHVLGLQLRDLLPLRLVRVALRPQLDHIPLEVLALQRRALLIKTPPLLLQLPLQLPVLAPHLKYDTHSSWLLVSSLGAWGFGFQFFGILGFGFGYLACFLKG